MEPGEAATRFYCKCCRKPVPATLRDFCQLAPVIATRPIALAHSEKDFPFALSGPEENLRCRNYWLSFSRARNIMSSCALSRWFSFDNSTTPSILFCCWFGIGVLVFISTIGVCLSSFQPLCTTVGAFCRGRLVSPFMEQCSPSALTIQLIFC